MSNPYGVPYSFDYSVVLSYLGFSNGSDYTSTAYPGLPSPVNDPSDHSGYDQLVWLSPSPQPTWAQINSNNENAYVAAYQVNFPLEYADLMQEYQINQKVDNTITVNGHPLSANVTVAPSDLTQDATHRFASDTEKATWNGKQNAIISGNTSQYLRGDLSLATLPVDITVYNGTSIVSNPKIVQKTGTVTSGTAVFYLTADGTSTGAALLTNVHSVNIDINSSAASYGYSWALSNSNKTLTVTVVQPGSLVGLGLIPFVSAANGVVVNVRVFGN